jgi:hypothetical protein
LIAIESIIARLVAMEEEYALDACRKPVGKEAFDYGRMVGRVQGLGRAREEITKMIEEDAKNEVLREIRQ